MFQQEVGSPDNQLVTLSDIKLSVVSTRGRFAVVRKCIQKCSGQELAAKVISRKLVRKEAVETEFNTLQSLQHSHLVQAYDLYESHANLIIIMQL